ADLAWTGEGLDFHVEVLADGVEVAGDAEVGGAGAEAMEVAFEQVVIAIPEQRFEKLHVYGLAFEALRFQETLVVFEFGDAVPGDAGADGVGDLAVWVVDGGGADGDAEFGFAVGGPASDGAAVG